MTTETESNITLREFLTVGGTVSTVLRDTNGAYRIRARVLQPLEAEQYLQTGEVFPREQNNGQVAIPVATRLALTTDLDTVLKGGEIFFAADMDDGSKGIMSPPDLRGSYYLTFRADLSTQVRSPDWKPMPSKAAMTEITEMKARGGTFDYPSEALKFANAVLGPKPQGDVSGLKGFGLNTESVEPEKKARPQVEDPARVAFPDREMTSAVISMSSEKALEAPSPIAKSIAGAVVSDGRTRFNITNVDREWARSIISDYLTKNTDIRLSRISLFSQELGDILLYGILNRLQGEGVIELSEEASAKILEAYRDNRKNIATPEEIELYNAYCAKQLFQEEPTVSMGEFLKQQNRPRRPVEALARLEAAIEAEKAAITDSAPSGDQKTPG